jgi:cob(I)alamin adenosyltransferase
VPPGGSRDAMKIYTKTGDAGETGLFGGPRVRKDHARIEAFGTVDELNSHLGVVRSLAMAAAFDPLLRRVQADLFELGAQLATPPVPGRSPDERITAAHVTRLETEIDGLETQLEPLTHFILPAGTALAAAIHVARTVCRRAERRVVTLATDADGTIPANAIEYLNRLGDMLFVLARVANRRGGVADDLWIPS